MCHTECCKASGDMGGFASSKVKTVSPPGFAGLRTNLCMICVPSNYMSSICSAMPKDRKKLRSDTRSEATEPLRLAHRTRHGSVVSTIDSVHWSLTKAKKMRLLEKRGSSHVHSLPKSPKSKYSRIKLCVPLTWLQ